MSCGAKVTLTGQQKEKVAKTAEGLAAFERVVTPGHVRGKVEARDDRRRGLHHATVNSDSFVRGHFLLNVSKEEEDDEEEEEEDVKLKISSMEKYAAPAAVALVEAVAGVAEGKVSASLAMALLDSRRHDYLSATAIVQGLRREGGAQRPLASADVQKLVAFSSHFLR